MLTMTEREELERFRRENKQLKLERDIPAKARPGSPGPFKCVINARLLNCSSAKPNRASTIPHLRGT
jgi:hypothetical protein